MLGKWLTHNEKPINGLSSLLREAQGSNPCIQHKPELIIFYLRVLIGYSPGGGGRAFTIYVNLKTHIIQHFNISETGLHFSCHRDVMA